MAQTHTGEEVTSYFPPVTVVEKLLLFASVSFLSIFPCSHTFAFKESVFGH